MRSDAKPFRSREVFRGCLLGGAVGDALGAPIEFMSLAEIRQRFGPAGVTGLVDGSWPAGSITDDTQMTLFTAEAMIRFAAPRSPDLVSPEYPVCARRAYVRWLHTQGEYVPADVLDGWLVRVPHLQARRAPGNTCLAALRAGGRGTPERPANDSKGCGAVMRIAPVGLALPVAPFDVARRFAAVTHGHPTAQLSAGFLAELVANLSTGDRLHDAVNAALKTLVGERGHEETTRAVDAAVRLAASLSKGGEPTPEHVESLGGGWTAEEALAIGLFCTLVAKSFEHGVLLAVNHSGDSDSTGAIAGTLLGLVFGEGGIPKPWLARLELRDVIAQVASDLWDHWDFLTEGPIGQEDRYPPT